VAVNLAWRGVGPLRFGLDADSFGDPVDVVEEGDHLDRIVDTRVAPAVTSKAVDVIAETEVPDGTKVSPEPTLR